MNYWWSLKLTMMFEHECAIEKVMCNIMLTPKSASVECNNCHKKYFYRKVELNTENQGIGF